MDDPRERELASLRRRLAESEENLRLVRERESQYVMATDVPFRATPPEDPADILIRQEDGRLLPSALVPDEEERGG